MFASSDACGRAASGSAPFGQRLKGLGASLILACTAPSLADVLHVDDDADPSFADGLSWSTAFADLHDALAAARAEPARFDAIWIAGGVYRPAAPGGDRLAFFDTVDGVALRGGFAGTETSADQRPSKDNPDAPVTILSGDLNGDDVPGDLETNKADNCVEIVVAQFGVQSLELDRLVIEGGYRDGPGAFSKTVGTAVVSVALENTMLGCEVRDNAIVTTGAGGGNVIFGGAELEQVTVESSSFVNNRAPSTGAGMFVAGRNTEATIRDSHFERNRVIGEIRTGGGALYATCQSLILERCVFRSNSAQGTEDLLFDEVAGGAVLLQRVRQDDPGQNLDIRSCTFVGNEAESTTDRYGFVNGGAVAATNLASASIRACVFRGNSARSPGAQSQAAGGAVSLFSFGPGRSAEISVVDSVFTKNVVEGVHDMSGAALSARAGQDAVWLEGCAFSGNRANAVGLDSFFGRGRYSGAADVNGGSVEIVGCDWENNELRFVGGAAPAFDNGGAGSLMVSGSIVRLSESSIRSSSVTMTDEPDDGNGADDSVASAARVRASTVTVDSLSLDSNEFEFIPDRPGGTIGGSGKPGAALIIKATNIDVRNSLISRNTGPLTAGLVVIPASDSAPSFATITNSTVTANRGGAFPPFSGVIPTAIDTDLPTSIVNSIIWGNTDASDTDGVDEPLALAPGSTVDHSIVENLDLPGVANLDADPLFVNIGAGDFRVREGSPAIDSGDTTRVPAELTLDLDGNPRVLDDPTTPDTGVAIEPGGPVVDRGAYEFVYDPACPADLAVPFGVLDLADIVGFVTAFSDGSPAADLAEPLGSLDMADITRFIELHTGGCP